MKKFIEKNYFLILPFLVTIFMLLQNIAFSTIDDRFMMEMANSFKTNMHSEHLMFINISFGYFLKGLYNLLPEINWFAILYIALVNIAFIPLYKISQHYDNKLVFAGIIAALQIAVFSFLTFTFLPFVCATSAVLWSLENVRTVDKAAIKHLLLSFALLCLGFGMRAGSTFVCIVLIFLPIYYFAVMQKRNSVWTIILLILIMTAANYGMTGLQKAYKRSIPEETYFNQFQEYRASISDRGNINYDEKKEVYDSLGISKNDIKLYENWKYADKNVFSKEKLEGIVASQTFSDKYTFNIFELSFHSTVVAVVFVYIVAATICMILLKRRRKEIFAFSVFVLGAILFLHIRKRAPFRVVFPIVILAIFTLMHIVMQEMKNGFKIKSWQKKMLYLLSGVLIIGVSGYNILNISQIKNTEIETQKVIEYINSDKTKIYLTDQMGERDFAPHILSLHMEEDNSLRPYNIFGDWYVYSYFWYDRLDKLNLLEYQDCTFKALLDERVRMVYGKEYWILDQICLFLKENYGINSKYRVEKAIDGTKYSIYKFDIIE